MKQFQRRLVLTAMLTLPLGVTACGDESEPDVAEEESTPLMEGPWGGSSGGLTISLTLAQTGENLSGSGTISGDAGSGSLSASGTNVYPNVALTLKSSGFYDINFSGRFTDAKTVVGTMHGSGFSGESLTLTKR